MKNSLATLILTAALSATLGVTSLHAEEKAVATVPFAFHVQNQLMPAGKYTVKSMTNASTSLFIISDSKGNSRFVGAPLQGKADPESPKLTFACYQGNCSLAQIDLPGSSVSHALKTPNSTHNVGMASMIAVRVTH